MSNIAQLLNGSSYQMLHVERLI